MRPSGVKNSNADLTCFQAVSAAVAWIPEPLGLTPQAVGRRDLTAPRGSLAAEPVQRALPHVGGFQRTGRPAPGRPQGAAPFAERVKDVQRIVDVGLARGATPGTLQLQPFAQATAVVPNHGLQ